MKLFLFSCITLAVLSNIPECSSSKEIFQEIKFGEGGGFTGMVMEYTIYPNGEIHFSNSITKEHKKIRTISRTEREAVQKALIKVPADALSFNHPGNLYYFIEIDKNRAVWGDPSFPEPLEIKELYDRLQKLVNP